LLNRNISVATGVSARIAPASSAAPAGKRRRTLAYSTPTDATPASACGASTVHGLSPKIRAARSDGHSDAGGLSTVMKFEASEEPKNMAFQLLVAAWTAAL
jgi:hypothetical protein